MFTFGGAVGNRVIVTSGNPPPFTGSKCSLITCWAFPTTLTAAKYLWGMGTVCGLAIDTVTSGLNVTLDAVTTDGLWTIPTVLNVNTMVFIAVLTSMNSAGATAAVKVWTGTETSRPVERAVTATTAPIGAWTSGGTTMQIGNRNSLASFQGDIGGFVMMVDDIASSMSSVLGNLTSGTFTQAEVDRIAARFVDPLWRGDLASLAGGGRLDAPVRISNGDYNGLQVAACLDDPLAKYLNHRTGILASTISGATLSTRPTPHPFYNGVENYFAPGRCSRRYAKVS